MLLVMNNTLPPGWCHPFSKSLDQKHGTSWVVTVTPHIENCKTILPGQGLFYTSIAWEVAFDEVPNWHHILKGFLRAAMEEFGSMGVFLKKWLLHSKKWSFSIDLVQVVCVRRACVTPLSISRSAISDGKPSPPLLLHNSQPVIPSPISCRLGDSETNSSWPLLHTDQV